MKKYLETVFLHSLRGLAKLQLLKNCHIIVGVTGSAGKTSTVMAIAQVLSTRYQVKQTHKGNSETGLPLEILSLPIKDYVGIGWVLLLLKGLRQLLFNWEKYRILVIEMGVDSDTPPKNMGYLLSIVRPQIGVFLNVGTVHGANFAGKDTKRAIAQEKGKLLTSLPHNGLAVISQDHPEIVELTPKITAPIVTFSTMTKATIQLDRYAVGLSGTNYSFTVKGQQYQLHFAQQCHFKAAFGGFAAAILIGQHLDVPVAVGIEALQRSFNLLPGRLTILEGINQSTILDSSYNSSLEPAREALHMLKQIKATGKRIAVLGDMREIGQAERADHEALAVAAADVADTIILVGPLTRQYTLPKLKQLGVKQHIYSFITAHEAVQTVIDLVKADDLILVKGSQNTIFLEIIVKTLMKHPEQAEKLLCRQTPYWEKQRQKLLKS